MCHEATGKTYDRPLFSEDVPLIARHYAHLGHDGIAAIYQAITDHHWPQPAVLVTVLEMVDRARRGDIGYYTYPTMPFSAMDLETYERVQSDSMFAFHAVFESMALAQRNMVLLNDALKAHFDLQLVLFCDCGCSIVPAGHEPFLADWYQEINQLRSLAEAVGTPVVRVVDFADQSWSHRFTGTTWVDRSLDMGEVEIASYQRMFGILQSLPARAVDIRRLASPQFFALFVETT